MSTTAPSGFAGFNSMTPAMTTAPTTDAKEAAGGFGLKPFALGGGGTTGSSTAATSVSGDSTDTTPAPIKKDFAGFSGSMPSTTPTPDKEEKTEEKKVGFAGFGAFGAKKDESSDKKEETSKGLSGFGAPVTTTPEVGDKVEDRDKVCAPDMVQGMKNKTMEEIINKWTGELDRCSEEFKTQATDIRSWDAILVENGDKIAKLYTATLEATQSQERIDSALTYIQDSQSELTTLLDHYEDVVRECFEQLGGREGMQPADQERQTMYSLAETVNAELDECVKGLGGMIEEINASAKGGGGDLLGEVVKVLNEQLASLGWIDEVSARVEEKVQRLEREAGGVSEGFS